MRHALLWTAAIGCALMAGVYFAFSAFVMAALATLPPDAGAAAMNAVNVGILRSAFMPLFGGTTLLAIGLAGHAAWTRPAGAWPAVAGGVAYAVGMFGVTAAFNVPLNDALAADPAGVWARYLREWTPWNHVRALASLGAAVAFGVALVRRLPAARG